MELERSRELSPESSELVERGDLDELTFRVNVLVADRNWAELDALRERCRLALDRGKQLWAVAAYIEYRLCLEAPGHWGALVLETGTGRFAFGPLPEVAASTHSWAELAPHLHSTPQAAMAAHERVLRGEDLTADPLGATLPEVLEMPLRLEPWEPEYALAEYHPDRMEAPAPGMPALRPVPADVATRARTGRARTAGARTGQGGEPRNGGLRSTSGRAEADEVSGALEELVSAWTAESNGRAEAVAASGGALDAISALGARVTELVELTPALAIATMAWSAATGGAYGRRRGAAPGRFAAWWVVAALGDLTSQWPPRPEVLGQVAQDLRWYAWGSGEPVTGWGLRLAIESTAGPNKGRAWAVTATDAA